MMGPITKPRGRVRLHHVAGDAPVFDRKRGLWLPPGFRPATRWRDNLVMYAWTELACRLFGDGDRNYRLSTMYLEYMNVADPGDAVTIPTFGRGDEDGLAYYDSLADVPDVDYVRADIISATRRTTDEDLYPTANQLLLFAMSTGTTGVHGLPFSTAANSKVYGAALVATPDAGDASRDLVMSRTYYEADEQMLKLATSQLGNEWELNFE